MSVDMQQYVMFIYGSIAYILNYYFEQEVSDDALGRATFDNDQDQHDRPISLPLSAIRPNSIDGGRGRSASDVEKPMAEPLPTKKAGKRRSSVFGFGKSNSFSEPSDEKPTTPVKKKNRRSSILNSFKSDAQLVAMDEEKKKSKLRPPSYTDRILVHSLRREKLSIDAYGFCDSIRCSDHRPVASAMTLTVSKLCSALLISAGQCR